MVSVGQRCLGTAGVHGWAGLVLGQQLSQAGAWVHGTCLVLRSSGVVLEPGFPKVGLEFERMGLGPGSL